MNRCNARDNRKDWGLGSKQHGDGEVEEREETGGTRGGRGVRAAGTSVNVKAPYIARINPYIVHVRA